jgi:hypothetical protein
MVQGHRQAAPAPVLDYAGPVPNRRPVTTYLAHSIVATLVFFPLGLVALVSSISAERALRRGNCPAAEYYATRAVVWGIGAIVFWFLFLVGIALVGTILK